MVSEKDVLVAAAVFVLALISHSESMLLISIGCIIAVCVQCTFTDILWV